MDLLLLIMGIVLLVIGGMQEIGWLVIVGIVLMAFGGVALLFTDTDDVFSWFD